MRRRAALARTRRREQTIEYVRMIAKTFMEWSKIVATLSLFVYQPSAVADDVRITLERTSCFGPCPVYMVTIDARGDVVYDGVTAVRVTGRQTDRVPPARVVAILETAERIGFFDLNDRYSRAHDGTEVIVDDVPTTFVTITQHGRSKRVEDIVGAPEGLRNLERQIDEAAYTKRWIMLDEPTLQQLLTDGWLPTAEKRASFLRQALEENELGVVKRLIELGADPNGGYFGTHTPPLMLVQSAAAARILLEAGANPNARNDNGGTPLGWSTYLAPEVAAALLEAGARVDDPTDRAGATALSSAAAHGNVGLVSLLLSRGANPAASADGKSALDNAIWSRNWYRMAPPMLGGTTPYVQDYDAVIRLLEQALASRSRR